MKPLNRADRSSTGRGGNAEEKEIPEGTEKTKTYGLGTNFSIKQMQIKVKAGGGGEPLGYEQAYSKEGKTAY